MKKESLALKLPFEPGEFLCTWKIPNLNKGTVDVSGLLNLEVGKYPYGTLYGELPIKWVGGGASFPQRHTFDSLVGRLASGGSVALMNGELSYWFENQGRTSATFAVLSRDELIANKPRKYQAIELQIDGLDAILGQSPISQVQMPDKTSDKPAWAATINREAHREWEIDGDEMSVWYNASMRVLDFYEFRMVFGSVLRITSTDGLTAGDWWVKWVQPLRQLISLITQASRDIHGFLAIENANESHASRDQVFGWDITQSTQNTSRDQVEATKALVNLVKDEANLLSLLKNWQTLSYAHHPLLETYGSMTTTTEQHPRSRVLLLLQALEGLYGFETAEKRAEDEAKYLEKREAVIERAREASLKPADIKFLNKGLMRRPPSGLLDALVSIFKSLPIDIRKELDSTTLFVSIRTSNPILAKEHAEKILVKIRNDLSHGLANFEAWQLREVAELLERVARSEILRVIDAPQSSRIRALEKND